MLVKGAIDVLAPDCAKLFPSTVSMMELEQVFLRNFRISVIFFGQITWWKWPVRFCGEASDKTAVQHKLVI